MSLTLKRLSTLQQRKHTPRMSSSSSRILLVCLSLLNGGSRQLCIICAARLYASYSRRIVVTLHELSSKVLHSRIQHIMLTGCCGWTSSKGVGSNFEIWGSFGHGDWQVVFYLLLLYPRTDKVWLRCTTSCLLCYLSAVYPSYAIVFQGLIALDFSSHYMHMYRYANTHQGPCYADILKKFVSHGLNQSQTSNQWCQSNTVALLQRFSMCPWFDMHHKLTSF